MTIREAVFALALALCVGAITCGAAMFHPGAAWIVGGVGYGALSWLVLAE